MAIYRWRCSSTYDIAQVTLKTSQPLYYDTFEKNPKSGSAILIDETSFNTVGALMFL
jgi:sulfate adenylyltransferase subunit 1